MRVGSEKQNGKNYDCSALLKLYGAFLDGVWEFKKLIKRNYSVKFFWCKFNVNLCSSFFSPNTKINKFLLIRV